MPLQAFAPPVRLPAVKGCGERALSRRLLKRPACRKVLYGKLSSFNPVATLHLHEQPAPELDELVAWCATSGVQFHSLSLRQDGENRGLFATQHIKPGDDLISIPRSAALIAETASPDPPSLCVLSPISQTFWKQASWYIRLAIILLDHVHNPHSEFGAYICALPKDPGCILWAYHVYKRSALSAHLSRYHMEGAAEVARSQCKHQFVMFKNALPSQLRSLVDFAQFSWSVSVCISRAFGLPPRDENQTLNIQQVALPMMDGVSIREPVEYALFPGLDMANCSVRCKTSFKYEEATDSYVVSTGMNFESDRQVFVSYGSKPNDDLMLFYGFVEGLNPANCVLVPDFGEWVVSLAESCSTIPAALESKLKVLEDENLLCPKQSVRIENDRIDDDLMFSLRVALATSDELGVVQELIECSSPKRKTRSISLQNEVAVWGAIEEKCSELLHEIDAFSSEELQRLDDMYSHTPCTAAWAWDEYESDGELLYRYERHRVLNSTIERVQHFSKVSTTIGRVCTVLMPPSQSMIRADIFEAGVPERDTSGVNMFSVTAEDIQDIQRNLHL